MRTKQAILGGQIHFNTTSSFICFCNKKKEPYNNKLSRGMLAPSFALFTLLWGANAKAHEDVVHLLPKNNISTEHHAKRSLTLFAVYQDKHQPMFSRSSALDAIEERNSITCKALIKAARNEDVDELKNKLFSLMIKKAKERNLSKTDEADLKTIGLSALHASFDPGIIVKALLISEIVLTPDNIITEIKCLLARVSSNFTDNALIMINNAIDSSLFQLMINSDSMTIHHEIDTIISSLARDRVTESFSIFINEIPEEKLTFSKKALHHYLAATPPDYFHAKDFPRSYFRAGSWSTALLKTKALNMTATQDLYAFLKKIDDEFVLSLLIIENKKHFKTPAVKLKLRTLLSKIEPLNHQLINPMERATMAQANQFLNRNRSNN